MKINTNQNNSFNFELDLHVNNYLSFTFQDDISRCEEQWR